MLTSSEIASIRQGSRVNLAGPPKETAPRKPFPLGWRKVVLFDGDADTPTRNVVVTGDERWIPVALIKEVKNG